ncbi:SWR1 complex [Salix suchowensis]|nr:SWR1 complex [Salix suchowensis]
MEDDISNPFRRMSIRTRKIAPKMAFALDSNDNKTQRVGIAYVYELLENDYTGMEIVKAVDDDEASLNNDDTKSNTRQAKALENARKAPRNFLKLLHEAAVGPPSSTCHRHFCIVCEFTSNYTRAKCGMRFCSICCQKIHDGTRCLEFLA